MKKLIFLILLISSASFLQAQAPSPSQLMKATWAKILKQYKPKKTTEAVVEFDPDQNSVEWPLLYQHSNWVAIIEYPEVEEIDKEKLKNFEYEVPTPLGWPEGGPVRALSELFRDAPGLIKYYKTRRFEEMFFEHQENFKNAFIQRYGSTKNIYCLTSKENESSYDFVVVFFIVKNGVPKMVGFCMNYYSG
jgi:hypothetical protein